MITEVEELTNDTIQQKCLDFISHAEDHEKYSDQMERATICAEFEEGKQWTEDEYNRWKEVGIEPIVVNRCLSTVKTLSGLYLGNQQDITVIPRKGGSEAGARVLSEIAKHCQDEGGYETNAFDAFNSGNIQTESFILLDIDKTKSANGKVVFQSCGFFDCMIDPDCESYDIDDKDNGAKYVIVKKYIDRDVLRALYDEYRDASEVAGDGHDKYVAAVEQRSTFSIDNAKEYRDCVYIIYWKETIPALLFGDKKTGKTRIITSDFPEFRKKASKAKSRFYTENVTANRLHRSILINDRLMEDKPEPLGPEIDFFPGARYVPIYRKNHNRGILDDVTGINREENLRRTQVARLLNLTTNSGWNVGNKDNKKALDELMQYGSVPGLVVADKDFGGKVEKIQPNQLSNGHLVLAQQSSDDVKEITGLNSAIQGYDKGTNNDPGIVLSLKKEQGLVSNEGLFKNFRWTLEILGNKLLKILDSMNIYTDDEIRAIVSESHLIDKKMMQKAHDKIFGDIGVTLKPPQPLPPMPPELLQNVPLEQMPEMLQQIQAGIDGSMVYMEQYPMLKQTFDVAVKELAIRMLLDELSNGELSQYGIKVITSPSSPTARLASFTMMMAIQDKYGVIPPDILLEYSDIPNKEEIIQRIQTGMAAQAQQAQAGQQMSAGRQPQQVQRERVA